MTLVLRDALLRSDTYANELADFRVDDVGREDSERKEEKRQCSLPDLDVAGRDLRHDGPQPDVGEDGPGGRDEEHALMTYTTYFTGWNSHYTDSNNHEEIEGRRADDRAWPEVAALEVLADDFDDREKDLWRRRAKGHEREIRDGLVPDGHGGDRLGPVRVLLANLALLRGDHLDGRHETIGDDRHADEQIDEREKIDDGTRDTVARRYAVLRPPERNNQSIVQTAVRQRL